MCASGEKDPVSIKVDEMSNHKSWVESNEVILLSKLNFECNFGHPQKYLLHFCNDIRGISQKICR